MQIEGQTEMTKLKVDFRNFADVPKKKIVLDFSHALFCLLSTLGDAGLGLAPHVLVYSDPVEHFIRKSKTTFHF
jgi:hypothetical protein